jgi:hypothetical protein
MLKLVFGKANAKLIKLQEKLGRRLFTFSTLAAWNCPGAKDCQSFAVETPTGLKIRDGKHTLFRCFSASQEVLFPSVYKARKNNQELITLAAQSIKQAVKVVLSQLPASCEVLRIHVSGDYKTLSYFDMWLEVAKARPNILFYAYTKSIPFWVKRIDKIPNNLILTASLGGKYDDLALSHNLRTAKVVYSEQEANELGLPIDHDDYLAATNGGNFALLIHGSQPKGGKAATAWARIKKTSGGYSKQSRKKVGV